MSWSFKYEYRSDIYVYFNVNFNVFFKLVKVHLLVSELYSYNSLHFIYLVKFLFPQFLC